MTDSLIATTLRGAWPSLPALFVASAGLCVAATVPVLIAPGLNPFALLLAAVLAGPFLAALLAVANTIAFGDPATITGWLQALRTHAPFAIRQSLIAALPAGLFLAALTVWIRDHPLWTLPSLALTGAATVLAVLGLLAALPLGLARSQLRGLRLWITALHLVARRPTRFLAALTLPALGLWAATSWTASLLLLIPAPTAIITVAALWTTASEA
jgi:hypothetical protein